MSVNLDAIRDVAREVSTLIVARELESGSRVRTPSDPGSTYVRPAFRYLLVAADHGLIEVKPRA